MTLAGLAAVAVIGVSVAGVSALRKASTDGDAQDGPLAGPAVATTSTESIIEAPCKSWFFAATIPGQHVPPADYLGGTDASTSKAACEKVRGDMETAGWPGNLGPCVCVSREEPTAKAAAPMPPGEVAGDESNRAAVAVLAPSVDLIKPTDPKAAEKFCERIALLDGKGQPPAKNCASDMRKVRDTSPTGFAGMLACVGPGSTADSVPGCFLQLQTEMQRDAAASHLDDMEFDDDDEAALDIQEFEDEGDKELPPPPEPVTRTKSEFTIDSSWVSCDGKTLKIKGKSPAEFEAELEELSPAKDIVLRWPDDIDPATHCTKAKTVDPFDGPPPKEGFDDL